MKQAIIAVIVALIGLSAVPLAAQAGCGCVKHHVIRHKPHHRVMAKRIKHCCEAAPAKVEETPVVHTTKVIERTIVVHEIIELPARVIAPRPCCGGTIAAPTRRLACCPRGMHIPGLPLCAPGASRSIPPNPQVSPASWTPQGKSDVCNGRPKLTPFKCISPSSGREVTCECR